MAFIPTPQVARTALRYSLNSRTLVNTLWFFNAAGEWGVGDLESLNDTIQVWWAAEYAPFVSTGLVLQDITSTSQESSTAPSVVLADGSTNGEEVSPALPNNVTMSLKFSTAERGRGGRGRNYICGLTETNVSGNTIDSGFIASLVGGYAALKPDYLDGDWTHVVVSHYVDGVALSEGVAKLVNAYGVVDNRVDTQRKRLD